MTENLFRDVPYLIGEIRSRVTPEAKAGEGMPSPSGTNRAAPLSVSAVDDSDEFYAALIGHCMSIANELRIPVPRLVYRRQGGRPLGLPSLTTVNAAVNMSRQTCRFIEYNLPFVSNDLADDVYTDCQRRYSMLSARYQTKAESEQMPARCPICLCLSVFKNPPKHYGEPEHFHCRTCMHVLTEAEAYRQCEVRARELKDRRRKAS